MPSRKQRRRREKLQRHEYEYVIETEEGEEVVESLREVEPESAPAPRRADRDGKRAPRKPTGPSARGPVDRRGRPIPEPSIRRVLKRALIFMPFFVIFFFIAAPSLTLAQKIFQALLLAALFIPASYLADRLIYRMALRRQQGGAGRARR
jgi:hypothetical protein